MWSLIDSFCRFHRTLLLGIDFESLCISLAWGSHRMQTGFYIGYANKLLVCSILQQDNSL